MANLVERLQALNASLRGALSRQDWNAIGVLDKQCTALVQEVARLDTWTDHQLHEQINALSGIFMKAAGQSGSDWLPN